jgi:hypothetical protein
LPELDRNPFTQPRPVDGSPIDATLGRGFEDDGGPTPLTRRAKVLEDRIRRRLKAADKFVEENRGFMKVRLTRPERIDAYEQLASQDFERIAGIHKPEDVMEMKRQYILDVFAETGAPPVDGAPNGTR